MKILLQLVLMVTLMPAICGAENNDRHSTDISKKGIADLSLGLQNLLIEEMRELQKGMIDILPLYVSGKWAEIVAIASKIEDSFVLKQSLSEVQIHELHSKLPVGFIELDKNFHYLAGMLKHAAKIEKPELVGFYFSKMSDTCVSCHAKYATQRFPDLAPKIKVHVH